MPKQVYICEKCGQSFTTEESARFCEERHVEPKGIVGFGYTASPDGSSIGHYSMMTQEGRFPSQLTVEFDDSDAAMNGNKFATYRLEHIGPKPV